MTPEGKVKKDTTDWLVFQGFIKCGDLNTDKPLPDTFVGTFYMPVPHPFQVAGIADFVLCVAPTGRTLWIECKAPGGKVSGAQEERHKEIRASGGVVWLVDSLESLIFQAVESKLFDVLPYHKTNARRQK